MSVLAVVVSFNRVHDLENVIDAVLAQTLLPDAVLVVDNNSTDGSLEMLREYGAAIDVLALAKNIGGAGGFARGVSEAIGRGYGYIWMMDDDAVPDATCLELLLKDILINRAALAAPQVLDAASGTPLRSHIPKRRGAPQATNEIMWASFVGPLIDLKSASKTHLPFQEFFLWNDDVEYTARLARFGGAVYSPTAVIRHPDAPPTKDLSGRLTMYTRNLVWLVAQRRGLIFSEKVAFIRRFGGLLRGQLSRSPHRATLLLATGRGIVDGLGTRPLKRYGAALAEPDA